MLFKKFENGRAFYQAANGAKYQYDLSNPAERKQYEIDILAQTRDKLSVNPLHFLNQQTGMAGGGILDD
ncbi:hypothetical protein [Lonepinella sp. MS14437]|uniref:hypothetical protein n=1 Tax=Lonepinella sp. MS14437 TaxID=3003620 RepID=UPI0036D8B57B